MKYAIKRGNTVIIEVHAEGQVTERIMGEQLVDATFSLPTKVQFQLWDSIAVDGKTYYLHATPTEEKISSRNFRYTLQFAGVKYFLANELLFFPDKNNELTVSEFSITGTATQILNLIVQNANREQSGWSIGNVATSQTKTVDFSGHSCLAALAKVAEAFGIEYWVDANKSIHLEERREISGYSFEYGIHKGLKGITRLPVEGANIVTRLYAEGGEKNLPGGYRNYKKRLQMPVPYLENGVEKYDVIETIQRFDDIYPHRIGRVTDIVPANPLQFIDASMPFDLNEKDADGNTTVLINNVSAKVTFNTGQLAGYTFEIKEHGYDHATKAFELLVNQEEKDLEVPSEALRPSVGDTYVITDIIMPSGYISSAELELQAKAQEYLNRNSVQRNVYEVVADSIYFAEQNVNVQLGHTCLFKDADFGLNDNLRVLGTVKNLQNLKDVRFELGDTATVVKIIREHFKVEKKATELRKYLRYNAAAAKRSYQFAREIADNVFDNEGYFDAKKIKPLSIDTKLLTVGSRSQQFNLVDIVLTVEQNNTAVRNTAGQIIHLTIEDTPRTWEIAANVQTGIGTGFHYVYVKAQRVGGNASILVSPKRIMLEQDEVFWHFEAGYLGSVQDGFRRIKTVYGFTQVSPGEIVTGRMSSANGQHYIDLLQDRINIKGNVTFTADSPALEDVKNISRKEVSGLQISSKNLAINTYVSGYKKKAGYFTIQLSEILEKGKRYTVGFDAKFVKNTGFLTALAYFDAETGNNTMGSGFGYIESSGNKRYSATLNITNSSRNILLYPQKGYASSSSDAAGEVIFSKISVYEGDKDLGASLSDEERAVARKKEIEKAKQEALDAVDTVANSVTALDSEVKGTFRDSIITDAEKKILNEKMNVVSSQKDNIIASYTKIYTNENLQGSAKSSLLNTKTTFSGKVDILLSTINTVISDSNITDAERARVEKAFKEYNNAYTVFRKSLEVASAAIQEKIKAEAEAKARELVDNVEIGGRNLLPIKNIIHNQHRTFSVLLDENRKKKGVLGMGGDFYFSNNRSDNQIRLTLFATTTADNYQNGDRIYVISKRFEGLQGGRWHHLFSSENFNILDTHTQLRGWFCDSGVNGVYPDQHKDLYVINSQKDLGWSPAYEDMEAKIADAKQIGIDAQLAAKAAQQSNKNLKDYVDGAFEDDVLTAAEKKAIEKYKNTLNETMGKAEASYLKVYTNTYLEGIAKTNLSNAKIILWSQRDVLVAAINTALANTTTSVNIAARKAAIDSAFTSFNSKMKDLQGAVEDANKAMQERIKSIAEAKAKELVNTQEISSENLLEASKSYEKGISDTMLGYNQFWRVDMKSVDAKLKIGDKVTLGFDVKMQIGTILRVYDSNNSIALSFGSTAFENIGSKRQRLSWTFTVREGKNLKSHLLDFYNTDNGDKFIIENIKISKGEKDLGFSLSESDIVAGIADAKQIGIDAQLAAKAAQQSNKNLKDYVDGAFEDDVLTTAEKKAVEKYKNTLNETMSKAEASYLKVYTNTYLEGIAKTNLSNAKIILWSQRDVLVAAINTALANTTTSVNIAARKAAIDSAFTSFNSKMKDFQGAVEDANKAIQNKIKAEAEEKVNNLQISSKNLAINTYVSGYKKEAGYFTIQLSEILEKDKRYTVGFDAKFVKNTGFLTALAYFDAETGNNAMGSGWGYIESEGNKRYSVTLEITNSSRNILLYPQKGYASSSSSSAGEVIFSNVAVYRGDKDLGASLSDSEKATERKKEIEKAKQDINARLAAAKAQLNANISSLSKKTKFLEQTEIEGAAIATGALLVGNEEGANAGLSGVDHGDDAVRFWAGDNYEDRKTAPYRVTDEGALYSSSAHIEGHIIAHSGSFKGYMSAPFLVVSEVYNDMELDLSANLNIVLDVTDSLNVNLPTERKYNGATSVIVHNNIGRLPMTLTVNNTYYVNYALLAFLAVPTDGSKVTWVKIYEQHLPSFNAN